MSVIINGDTGITTPAETVQGALTTTGNTILGDAATDTLNVGAGGLVKDASGNVGIGTSNSAAGKLSVAGRIGAFNTTGANDSLVQIWNSGTSSSISSTYSSTGAYTPIDFLTSDTVRASITVAGLFQFNSGYGSVATAYGCRAWVNFNGTGTVAIRASGNVSSITDNGTGDYTVNFTTAMPDANYASVCNSSRTDTPNGSGNNHTSGTAPATGSIRVIATIPTTATANDQAYFMVAIFR